MPEEKTQIDFDSKESKDALAALGDLLEIDCNSNFPPSWEYWIKQGLIIPKGKDAKVQKETHCC